jgi:predicted O-linked N-acetylglucosamine transferase (SPINDLY family)
MRILSKVDGSILWLPEGNNIANKNLKIQAEKNNIDESRIIFAQRLNLREEHLKRIQLADLFLDTTPYNAHATTSDALQMGLPVLTFKGNSFVSRVASSLIKSVNLSELITTTLEQYESLAIQLAKNPKELKTIKEKLFNNLPNSPLYDTTLYIQHLESAYLKMYERLKKDLDPDHIYVDH